MDNDIRYIEDYLNGTLSDKDIKAFLSRLESDDAFKAQFEFEKQLFENFNEEAWSYADRNNPKVKAYKSALDSPEFSELKQNIVEVSKNYSKNSSKSNSSRNLLYYVAAAVIAVFIAFQFMFNQPQTGKELYYAYVAMDDLPGFVTRSDSTETRAIKAQELFKEKQYSASIPLFQDLLRSNPNDGRLYLYLGVAQAETEDYDQALKVFDRLISSDLVDAEKGYWYKALTYLKMKENDKALALLQNIKTEGLFNAEKAGELIEELD